MVYTKIEYILISKIISEKIILEKKLKKFTSIFLLSLLSNKNIFLSSNFQWLNSVCDDLDITQIITTFSDQSYYLEAKNELKLCEENNIKIITYEENDFPNRLKEIEIPALILYYIGIFPNEKELNNSVSIIGSRECYPQYGGKLAYKIGEKIAREKKWNISGLALGIDTFGHLGSLYGGGFTGAFIAQGLLTSLYPKENEKLKKNILKKNGFIATEYPIYSKPYFKKFTLRNRLQAGLVDFLIVPEFNEKSGTLSTIEYGLKEKKEVYICNPKRTLERDKECKVYNKGNILFSFDNDKLKEIYLDFDIEDFKKSRLSKIKSNKNFKYEIVERIPTFTKKNSYNFEEQKLFNI